MKKIFLKIVIFSVETLVLIVGIKESINAALIPQVTSDFSQLKVINTPNNNYVEIPETNTLVKIKQPINPHQFPIKNIWANYVRDGKITHKTTKIFVVMGSAKQVNLPVNAYDSSWKTNNVSMSLYSTGENTIERGTSFIKEKPIDAKFLSLTNSDESKILNTMAFNEKSSIGFQDNSFYELLSPLGSSKPIMASTDYSKTYNLGPKVELINSNGKLAANYVNYMYNIDASNNLKVTPTVNKVLVNDTTVSGSGQQVGDKIDVTKNGISMGDTFVDNDGNWTLKLRRNVNSKDTIEVTETSSIPGDIAGTTRAVITDNLKVNNRTSQVINKMVSEQKTINNNLQTPNTLFETIAPATLMELPLQVDTMVGGDKLFTGKGLPGDKILVVKNGIPMGEPNTSYYVDDNGNWAMPTRSTLVRDGTIYAGDKVIVQEIPKTLGYKIKTLNLIVDSNASRNLPVYVYPTAIATRQVIGYGSQPGATISIGDGFSPSQKTTTVDSNGNWQLPIAPPDHIWDTTYNITITNARGSSTIKFQPFGITQVAPLNFGTVDLASISDYSKQLPLPKWDGISFGSDLTKTSPWEVSINKVTDFNANIKLYYRVGIGTGKMTNTEVTTTPMRFMNNNFKDVLNSVINGNTAKLSAKNNLYLDISKTKGLLKPTNYKATYNFALTDAPV